MQPFTLQSTPSTEPNLELVRIHGWSIASVCGPYCVAWKGNQEIVLVWRNAGWQRVGGTAAAAF